MSSTITEQIDDTRRFNEIMAILKRHQLTQGLTPEKVRSIFDELGPTFVKFGQILSMRSDILPNEYCTALESLRTDAQPMPIEEVYGLLDEQYGRSWQEIFSEISPRALGSASIAQAHEARLKNGERVVIKVQRPNLYATMERDIRLMKKVASLLKYTPIGSAVDFRTVLDEMWVTAQQELDFTIEAANLREFAENNKDVAYVGCPAVYSEYSTKSVLVMEYIGGHQIDDTEGLRADGYDTDEIAAKLVHNYIKQITTDRFFHADPHPGNIRVDGGRIVWLDLGMMGRLSKREADQYMSIINTMFEGNSLSLTDALLGLCKYDRAPDRIALSANIDAMLSKYEAMPMEDMDLAEVADEAVELLNRYGVTVPSSLTMLGRSLLVIQGMLAHISPRLNVIEVVAGYVTSSVSGTDFAKKKMQSLAKQAAISAEKLTALPAQTSSLITKASTGQLMVNVKKMASDGEYDENYAMLSRAILGAADCALIIAGAICSVSQDIPRILTLPWPSAALFAGAAAVSAVLIARGKKKK